MSAQPILYTFRRCPYAIRARMALRYAGIEYEHREVILRDRPSEMMAISPKGTVPVLQLSNGEVLEESLDIMLWCSPEEWLVGDWKELVEVNDGKFKDNLDRYKYSNRFDDVEKPEVHRNEVLNILAQYEQRLGKSLFFCGDELTLADVALAPFVRQFANTDMAWFKVQNLPNVQRWLEEILASELFTECMEKHEQWQSPMTQDDPNPLAEAIISDQPAQPAKLAEPAEMSKARQEMVEQQLLPRGISDPRVISAMSTTPRHLFLPQEAWSEAYRDHPLAIESGQTISQPFIVAMMSELLSPLQASAKVMEIGTGCGYQTAVLVALGYEVHSIERIAGLSHGARKTLGEIDSLPSELLVGDGMMGNPAGAPYDAIISTACARRVPKAWIDQVVEGGLIITPVKRFGGKQYLMRYTKRGSNLLKEDLGLVRFVPLLSGVDES